MAKERAADLVGHLQPAEERHQPRHRRHHALRVRQLDASAAAVRARQPKPVQHPRQRRACRPARSATPASPRSRRPPARRAPATSSTWPAVCGNGRHNFAKTDAEFQRYVDEYNRAREERGGKSPTTADDPRGVLGFPVAHSRSPAMMSAAFAELGLDWRYLHLPRGARALRGDGARAARLRLPRRQRDDPAQARGARAGRRAERRRRPRSALSTPSASSPAAAIRATTPTPAGCSTPWAARRPAAGARARRRRRRPGGRLGAARGGRGGRGLEPHAARGRGAGGRVRRGHAGAPGPAELLVNATSVGLER